MNYKINTLSQLRIFFFCFFLMFVITGCSSTTSTPHPLNNQVEIMPGIHISLPEPADLESSLSVSQLISAQWENQSNQLPVQLEVSSEKVVLAGFSSWGSRILSLTYQNKSIKTQVLSGLSDTLPKPEQVLFNLMLTLWPIKSWQEPLMASGWQLKETSQNRYLLDDNGDVVIEINYKSIPHLSGEILFNHKKLGYVIVIKTLNYN